MAADQILTRSEARAALRACLATWPVTNDATARFLQSLHWRARQAVVLVHGERLTVGAAAGACGRLPSARRWRRVGDPGGVCCRHPVRRLRGVVCGERRG